MEKNEDIKELEHIAHEMRTAIIEMNCHAGSGHPGGSLSATELVTWLFNREIEVTPETFSDPGRDRFVLSKGHSCLVLYAALERAGFFSREEFTGLRQTGRMLQGHPDRLKTPGVEFNSGSLGQGFSFALGSALGARLTGRDYRVYALLGDGELNEGQVWEGFMFGAHKKLDNMVAIIDYNKLQSDDLCDNVTALSPLVEKLEAFKWHVIEIDGHDFTEIGDAFEEARQVKELPTVIVANTIKGKGVSFMEGEPKWHGSLAPSDDERERAIRECLCEGVCK